MSRTEHALHAVVIGLEVTAVAWMTYHAALGFWR